ncbi:hypothetical protein J0H58_18315 [bacterium]|nr:hypothetical protein [bacterium]
MVTGVGGRVLVYAGRTLGLGTAFDTALSAPVSVAVGAGMIHVGSGVGVSAAVRAFNPADEFISADPAFEEVFADYARVATADLDADGGTDAVPGGRSAAPPRVRVLGRAIDFFAFDDTLRGGVFVG